MAIALLTACHDKKNEAGTTETPSVDVAKVVEDSVIMYSTLPGSLAAERTVDIVGRVNGQLLSQNYTPGDLVQAGQVLYTIESTSYRDAVQQAQARAHAWRSAPQSYSVWRSTPSSAHSSCPEYGNLWSVSRKTISRSFSPPPTRKPDPDRRRPLPLRQPVTTTSHHRRLRQRDPDPGTRRNNHTAVFDGKPVEAVV